MIARPWHAHLTMIGVVALTALVIVAPVELRARQRPAVADFAPPMTPAEAQAVVAAARAAERVQRIEQMQQQQGKQETAPLPAAQNMYFASSGFHISDRTGFLSFWRRNGGELIFGYPISGEMVEDGRIVQYFERARFEYHPEHLGTDYQVMLSLLGSELTQGYDFPDGEPTQGRIYFPETRQTLGGKFLKFWEKRAGYASSAIRSANRSRRSARLTGRRASRSTSSARASSTIPRNCRRSIARWNGRTASCSQGCMKSS